MEFGQLAALNRLWLNDNHLSALLPEIGQLWALTVLHLYHNRLQTLPPEIGQLSALKGLSLDGNQLTALPPELRGLRKLTSLYLHGNEALGLPLGVLGKKYYETGLDDTGAADPRAILDFYFSRQEEAAVGDAARALNEVKVLLVGRGEAGKTSVSRALRGETFNKEERETPGIVIEDWRMACPQGEVTAHLWDFAGQEITHETHRSFLTDRSLYLIVLDGRGGQQMEEADYWLQHVKKYGGGTSPAVVVLNKWHSPGPYDMARRQLQREHPCLRGFVETDCADGYGIPALREAMGALVEDMSGVRQEWAASYFKVSSALKAQEQKGRYFLSWKEYGEVCRSCQVAEERDEPLAENLNALGVALYYGHNPALRDTRVLRPQWAADGLYGLIQGVRVRPHAGHPGELRAGELRAVLMAGLDVVGQERKERKVDKKSYDTPEVQAFLLELLLDREIALRGGGESAQAVYLLPGLLPVDEPEVRDYDVAAHMQAAAVRWRWLYDFLPAGVMSRFIVKTHALSDAQPRWQQGVVLEWAGAQALVLAERRRNPRVEVYLKGGSEAGRLALAGMVRAFMESIHRDLPEGLRGKEELDLSLPGEQWTEVTELAEFEKAQKTLPVRTRGGIVEVRPTLELNRLEPESARREDAPRLKVFVSYSHDDHKDCDQMKLRLARLANEGLVSYWHDGQIRAGQEWDKVIRRELEDADVVILLMSDPFFASRYIEGVEVATARARQQRGEADILPVLLEECEGFKQHPWLGQLQTVPSVTGRLRPVRRFTPKMTAWDSVENELRRMIADLAKSKHRSGRRGY